MNLINQEAIKPVSGIEKKRGLAGKLITLVKKRVFLIEVVVIVCLTILFFALNRSFVSAILLTTEAIPRFPVKPLSLIGGNVIKDNVEIPSSDKKIKAVIYRPDDTKTHPVMVFTVGTGLLAVNDELLERVSTAMAKVGIVSVVPEIPLLAEEYVLEDSIPDFAATFKYAEEQAFAKKDKIGFAGFCVGGSLSLISASDKQISDRVAYIVLISPYFDNLKTVEAIVTKSDIIDGKQIPWQPNELSVKVARNGLLAYLGNTEERRKLQEILEGNGTLNDSEYFFSKSAILIYETARADTREKFEEVVSRYPADGKRDFDLISPKNYIDNLNPDTKLFVLSDKNDTFVPLSETRAFRNSFDGLRFTEIDSFEHVRPGVKLERLAAVKQAVKVFLFLNAVLDSAL